MINRYRAEEARAIGFADGFLAAAVDHHCSFSSATGYQANSAPKDDSKLHVFSIALSELSAMGLYPHDIECSWRRVGSGHSRCYAARRGWAQYFKG